MCRNRDIEGQRKKTGSMKFRLRNILRGKQTKEKVKN